MTVAYRNMIPMIAVQDVRRSLAFYRDALGFEVLTEADTIREWNWAQLRAGPVLLMLAGTEAGPALPHTLPGGDKHDFSAIYYFYPEDVRALHASLKSRGCDVTPLETTFYGMLEFSLRDPDGHLLSFGEDAEEST